MAVRIVEDSLLAQRDQLQPLLERHMAELARSPDLDVPSPNWALFGSLEASQMLVALFARDDDDGLVGYSVTFVGPHPHHVGLQYAHNQAIYVDPQRRGELIGRRLMAETERLARERGARMIIWSALPGTTLDATLCAQGYKVQDILYRREL